MNQGDEATPQEDESGETGRRTVMEWLTANWFWLVIFIAFVAMHMFGHGGHGSHGDHGKGDGQRSKDEGEKGEAQGGVVNTSSGGHRN